MAAHLERTLAVRATLVRGDDGVFDVDADGTRIFSKHESGRFPGPEEIERALRTRASEKR